MEWAGRQVGAFFGTSADGSQALSRVINTPSSAYRSRCQGYGHDDTADPDLRTDVIESLLAPKGLGEPSQVQQYGSTQGHLTS